MTEVQPPTEPPKPPTIRSIQVLRGIAATAVVLTHAVRAFTVYNAAAGSKPGLFAATQWGMLIGVDVFFVISGFIMSYISAPYVSGEKPALDFFARRLIRIYPMYLVATLIVALSMVVAEWRGDSNTPIDLAPMRLIDSLFFIPSKGPTGSVAPILGVGWTLTYEIYFYGIFTLSLAIARRHAAVVASAAIITICGLANLATGTSAIELFLRDTHVFEFIVGLAVGAAFNSGRFPKRGAAIMAGVAVAVLLLQPPHLGTAWDWLFLGFPAALLVVSCLTFERRYTVRSAPLLLFGDASYSIYLLHMSVIYEVLLRALRKAHIGSLSPSEVDGLILAIAAACVLAGLAAYQWVEKPLTRLARRLYDQFAPLRRRRSSLAAI